MQVANLAEQVSNWILAYLQDALLDDLFLGFSSLQKFYQFFFCSAEIVAARCETFPEGPVGLVIVRSLKWTVFLDSKLTLSVGD